MEEGNRVKGSWNFDSRTYLKAKSHLDNREYELAFKYYEESLQDKRLPDNIRSTTYLAMCACKVKPKEYDEDIYYGELALEYDTTNNDGYVNTAIAYLKLVNSKNLLSILIIISIYQKSGWQFIIV